jgi:hypothetical protein
MIHRENHWLESHYHLAMCQENHWDLHLESHCRSEMNYQENYWVNWRVRQLHLWTHYRSGLRNCWHWVSPTRRVSDNDASFLMIYLHMRLFIIKYHLERDNKYDRNDGNHSSNEVTLPTDQLLLAAPQSLSSSRMILALTLPVIILCFNVRAMVDFGALLLAAWQLDGRNIADEVKHSTDD